LANQRPFGQGDFLLIYAFSSLIRIPMGSHKLAMKDANTENSMTNDPTGEPTWVRNRRPRSPETREKIRTSLLGRKHSDERRRNISDALTGRRLSDEHRAACGLGQSGRIVSEDTRRKISVANTGRKQRPMTHKELVARSIALTGRIFTERHRENLSESQVGLKVGFKWVTSLRTTQERHLAAGEAADLVATGRWRWGRRPWR
jgi:hypothetical protein